MPGLGSFFQGRTWEKGGFVAAPARHPRRHRPADGAHQLEHRHGRRRRVVERGGLSRVSQVDRAGLSDDDQRSDLQPHALAG